MQPPTPHLPMLASLIAPVSIAEFTQEYWEKRPLHVRGSSSTRFESLLTQAEIEHVITALGPRNPDYLAMVSAARTIATSEYCYPSGVPNAAHVYKLYQQGATLIMPSLHRFLPKLNELCRALEVELTARAQTNIYMTPPGAQGFGTHFDNHDVLCLQVLGEKKWKLYERNRELVFPGEEFNVQVDDPGAAVAELVTRAGDALYLPRGVMHSAETGDSESLHITVGFFTTTWAQLLIEAVSQVALRHDKLRSSLPIGFGGAGGIPASIAESLPGLLREVASRADATAAAQVFADNLIMSRDPLVPGQARAMARLPKLEARTPLKVRKHLHYRIDRSKPEAVRLLCHGTEHELPPSLASALSAALTTACFTAAELDPALSIDDRLELVRFLVEEGCVEPAD